MRIRYMLTRWDLFRASMRALCFSRPPLYFGLGMFALAWGVIFAAGDHQDTPGLIASAIVATLVTLMAMAFSLCAITASLGMQAYLRNNQGMVGEHTLEITAEGLVEATDINWTVSKWESPWCIRETSHYAYIFISDGNAHVVPLRKPLREGSAGDFLIELRTQIRQAQFGRVSGVE